MSDKTKNRGELSEVYIFLRLLREGKIRLTDERVSQAFLDIISIIREETAGSVYRYYPHNRLGDEIQIKLNGSLVKTLSVGEVSCWERSVWRSISKKGSGGTRDAEIKEFLASIFINNISSPAQKKSDFCGGTSDIFLETRQPATGIINEIGFSIKSNVGSPPTLFNASGDNTNFVYELRGDCSDETMRTFNNIWKVKRDGDEQLSPQGHKVPDLIRRMQYLRREGIDIEFLGPASDVCRRNLRLSGGTDLLETLGAALKFFYYYADVGTLPMYETVDYLVESDPAEFGYSDRDILRLNYESLLKRLLYDAFSGMKLGRAWNGKREINGGYISVESDGSISAYHSCAEDEFKEFLYNKMRFEKPSTTRHNFMKVYKDGDSYYLKLNLQCRFDLD